MKREPKPFYLVREDSGIEDCGHCHRTREAAIRCQAKLRGFDGRRGSLKWWHSYIEKVGGEPDSAEEIYNAQLLAQRLTIRSGVTD